MMNCNIIVLESWEFVIDFHTPTVDVPILADKKLYIDKQLSFTIWLKTRGSGGNHYFSYPRIESGTSSTQLVTGKPSGDLFVNVKRLPPLGLTTMASKESGLILDLFSMKIRMET